MPPLDLVIAVTPRLLGDVLARALASAGLSVRVWEGGEGVEAAAALVTGNLPEGLRADRVVYVPSEPGVCLRVVAASGEEREVHPSSLEELLSVLAQRAPAGTAGQP